MLQHSPQRSSRRSSHVSLHQEPASRHALSPVSPARPSSAATSTGDDACGGGISSPDDSGPPQHQAVRTAPPVALIFVCEDVRAGPSLSHGTADAATQAEVGDEHGSERSSEVSYASERVLAASDAAQDAAHSEQGSAEVSIGVDESSTALPSEVMTDGDSFGHLASRPSVGTHGRDVTAEAGRQTQPAHEELVESKPGTCLASEAGPVDSSTVGVDGKGVDGQDSASDGGSHVVSGAANDGCAGLTALASDELRPAAVVADSSAVEADPRSAASAGESPAAGAQLQEAPDEEATQAAYSLSEQAMHGSEFELKELAALATQLQQVSLEHSDPTCMPFPLFHYLCDSGAWL